MEVCQFGGNLSGDGRIRELICAHSSILGKNKDTWTFYQWTVYDEIKCYKLNILEDTAPSVPAERCHKVLDPVFVLPEWQTSHSPVPESPHPEENSWRESGLFHSYIGMTELTNDFRQPQLLDDSTWADKPVRWHHKLSGAPGEVPLPNIVHDQANYTGTVGYSVHHCKTNTPCQHSLHNTTCSSRWTRKTHSKTVLINSFKLTGPQG